MILILKGADFSANNIGQIEISRKFQEETIAILSKYTKILTQEQNYAIDTFVVSLKSLGIYSKLYSIVLPILANDKTEALKNALSGNVAFGGNLNGISFGGNALGVIQDANKATLLSPGIFGNNMTIAVYVATKDHTDKSIARPLIGRSNSGSGNFYQLRNVGDNAENVASQSNGGTNLFTSTANAKSIVLSDNGTTSTLACDGASRLYTLTQQNSENTTAFNFGVYTELTYTGRYTKDTMSLIALGTALSNEECISFSNAISNLMTKFL